MRNTIVNTIALAGMLLFLAGGCTTTRPSWPAISDTPTDVRIQGRWVWGELLADNVEAEKTFYREVFGLAVRHPRFRQGCLYPRACENGRPIAGIIHYAKPADAHGRRDGCRSCRCLTRPALRNKLPIPAARSWCR